MECASTYLYLLQFLSSVSYNFLSTGLLHLRLGLFLDILIFFKNLIVVQVQLSPFYPHHSPLPSHPYSLPMMCFTELGQIFQKFI